MKTPLARSSLRNAVKHTTTAARLAKSQETAIIDVSGLRYPAVTLFDYVLLRVTDMAKEVELGAGSWKLGA
jgi:hypothetical protein